MGYGTVRISDAARGTLRELARAEGKSMLALLDEAVEVLRRQRVRVAAGRFDTIVVRPIIQTDGMFGEGGQAEVYLTGDERRIIVQIKTRMKVGELNMYLREYETGAGN